MRWWGVYKKHHIRTKSLKSISVERFARNLLQGLQKRDKVLISRTISTSYQCVPDGPNIPFSIVPALVSAFFFSLGTFWKGANSTTAMDSLPISKGQLRHHKGRRSVGRTGLIPEHVPIVLPAERSKYLLVFERDVRSRWDVLLVQPAAALRSITSPNTSTRIAARETHRVLNLPG